MNEQATPAFTHIPAKIDGRTDNRRILAISGLHFGQLGGGSPANVDLSNDLAELSEQWQIVCLVLNTQRQYCGLTPSDAPKVREWCIALAVEIVKAQEALDRGETLPASYQNTRDAIRKGFRELSRQRSAKKAQPK
jgi:hypothetical protein